MAGSRALGTRRRDEFLGDDSILDSRRSFLPSTFGISPILTPVTAARHPRRDRKPTRCRPSRHNLSAWWELQGLHTVEEGELLPFLQAVDINDPDLAQPGELGFDVDELARRVLVLRGDAHRLVKGRVEPGRGRHNMLQVAEEPARR